MTFKHIKWSMCKKAIKSVKEPPDLLPMAPKVFRHTPEHLTIFFCKWYKCNKQDTSDIFTAFINKPRYLWDRFQANSDVTWGVAPSAGHDSTDNSWVQNRRATAEVRSSRALFDLDADNPGISADVEVSVFDVSESVGEVHHAAVGKLDVKILHVEVDVELRKKTEWKLKM